MKSYKEFLKSKNNIVSELISNLDSLIDLQLTEFIKKYVDEFGTTPTEYDKEIAKLTYVLELVKSIEKYTANGDKLVKYEVSLSNKNNFVIYASIERNGQEYRLQTDVILAGGYNIQTLHYRYLTKTTLPKTNSITLTTELSNKLKTLTNNQKIQQEIQNLQNKIKQIENSRDSESYTETEVANIIRTKETDKGYFEDENLSWSEIIKRGADKNFKNESDFLEKREKYKKETIDFWLKINTRTKQQKKQLISDYTNQITKLTSKLK